jgi:hypothetical protein
VHWYRQACSTRCLTGVLTASDDYLLFSSMA